MNTKPLPAKRGLLSIGAFSRATRLSQKALRLYDQSGLLRPAYTDPDSGYRYYRTEQVRVAKLMVLLRRLEMPLDCIRDLLKVTPGEAADRVQTYWQSVEAQVVQNRRVVKEAVACLQQIESWEGLEMSDELPELNVTVKEFEPQTVIGISKRIKIDALENHVSDSLARLRAFVQTQPNVEVAGDAFCVFHGPVNTDDDGPMEMCLPVRGAVSPTGDIAAREIPGGQRAVVEGGAAYFFFPNVLKLYDAAGCWIQSNGHQMAGPPFEFSPWAGHAEKIIRVEWPFR